MKKTIYNTCVLLTILNHLYHIYAQDCELPSEDFPNGSMTVFNTTRLRLHYTCDIGFTLLGESKQVCSDNGQWEPDYQPKCVHPNVFRPKCARKSFGLNYKIRFSSTSLFHDVGDIATVICDPGFATTGGRYKESFQIICGPKGQWIMADGSKGLLSCSVQRCPLPPAVPNAIHSYGTSPPMGEGSRLEYSCRPGYTLVDKTNNYLTCTGGNWEGSIPTCVPKAGCHVPRDILNGRWTIVSSGSDNNDKQYPVGTKVQYYCSPGYKAVGSTMLECTDIFWSKVPPFCIVDTEPVWYCPELEKIDNGLCKCDEEDSNNLMFCKPYERGVKIQCMCNKGYTLAGMSVLTCTRDQHRQRGIWDADIPYCLASSEVTVKKDKNKESSDAPYSSDTPYSNDASSSVSNHVSTLVIVIATACSVLGILLLVMVIVVFRRKKQRPHLFHPGMTPTPYSRVNISSIDDHDRVALMAYADATRVHLPTYEEAMQQGQGQFRLPNSTVTTPTSTQGSEYRPLPHIPPTIRNIHNGSDSNRHSSATTSTMNRGDGTSEIFGSLDTVNVSMSDASTAGTVETFDSGTSTRSISSQRATAGSLMSSADNLANDDVRLLDNRSDCTELTTQEPIEEKED
ncbi:hypothetical protein LOTGIDRAFT_169832 [Lottia gigantea]|uniref:Sushi domain-containing protein n=1 Tax=Lottia gigantea TaxID=225164 RepID=V3ZQ50_LOTGI|nr:hypothetical protein LOTGIDRAFT_169832 [Lottia gigantea]ESO83001.1 hypothetical protein LOTGIDRAFT_169832 [Lottia gigantea]